MHCTLRYALPFLLLFSFLESHAQAPVPARPHKPLKDYGITFGASEALEGYYNFRGGIKRGTAWASTFDANMTIDLEKLIGLPHAKFYTDLEYHAGDNPTSLLTGDLQVFDKYNADPFLQLMEIWYQQQLFHNALRVKVGKIDANLEFSVIDNGLEFINSPTQVTPTLFVFPTFPDPMPAVNLFFTPGKLFYTSFGIFDANRRDRFLDFYGDPASVQPTSNGSLLISESGLTWDRSPLLKKDGNLRVGLWKHTGTFTKWQGGPQQGAEGFYLILDQTLWQPLSDTSGGRGIRTFLEYSRTDASVAPVWQHYGGGVVWAGPSAGRPDDACGISIQHVLISPMLNLPYPYELNFEAFYKVQITSWLDAKPDLQYIVHPGGQYSNALVGTLLLTFSLNS